MWHWFDIDWAEWPLKKPAHDKKPEDDGTPRAPSSPKAPPAEPGESEKVPATEEDVDAPG